MTRELCWKLQKCDIQYIWGQLYHRNCQDRKSSDRKSRNFSSGHCLYGHSYAGNGIQAMREIRKFNTTALFYVVSAYDKFDYAKEAIDLGVERYLTKPISKAKIISAVEEAIEKVDKKRNQRSNLLKIQENRKRSSLLWKQLVGSLFVPAGGTDSRLLPAASGYRGKNRAMSWSSSLASRMKMVG